jgi:RNA polymerase sigma factor (sigma-70 family)
MTITEPEFEQLFREHAPEILGYLRRRGAGDSASDLLAEAFLIAWRRRQDLPDNYRRAWLFATARRLLLAQQRNQPTVQMPDLEAPSVSATPAGNPTAEVVRAVLAALPEVDRELLTMTAWEHLPVAEAGRALGLNSSAARVRLHRVRRRLAGDPRLRELIDAADSPQVIPQGSAPHRHSDSPQRAKTAANHDQDADVVPAPWRSQRHHAVQPGTEIGHQIGRVLDTDAEAQHALADASGGLHFSGHRGMGHGGRM